ncbi:MAG: alpha/beta fold hydrolase [Spirochaetaceae bacterium]|nr:MAG: alpha/beta fold hydrolase [Spirochaetaceae bacterium]
MALPALLYLHGGAGIFGTPDNLDARHRALLEARGFTVISVDYPKVIGSTIHATPAALERTVTALAAESPTGTVVVVGHSFGGYLTLWLAATHPAVARAVALAGYGDLLADWYLTPSAHYAATKELRGFRPEMVTPASSWDAKFDLYVYLRKTGGWPGYVSRADLDSLAAISPLRARHGQSKQTGIPLPVGQSSSESAAFGIDNTYQLRKSYT